MGQLPTFGADAPNPKFVILALVARIQTPGFSEDAPMPGAGILDPRDKP